MEKKNIGYYLLAVAVGIIIMLLITRKSDERVITPTIPKIVVDLENQNQKEKEIINNKIVEIRTIENSENYKYLRGMLDSLMSVKDTTPRGAEVCYETVKIQDTIISKQKEVIMSQEKVILSDSLIKKQLYTTIDDQSLQMESEKKKGKKKLWRGRAEGAVVGGVVGFVLGKVL